MASSAPTVEDRALALRADALLICERAAWLPQCIGTDQFRPGVPEIYAELRCLQKVRAVRVSETLIACCQRHGMWTPYFADVEARIWLCLGDRDRAEARWSELLHHENRQLRVIAKQALVSLQRKVDSGERLATEVDQAMDRNETERVVEMLLQHGAEVGTALAAAAQGGQARVVNLLLQRDWGLLEFYLMPWFRERTFPGEQGRLRAPLPVDTDEARYESRAGQHHSDVALRWSHYFGDFRASAIRW